MEMQDEKIIEVKPEIVLKTLGGFDVTDFSKIENPKPRYPLEPFIYSGMLPNSKFGKSICEWDRFGKCSNWLRFDCFIDPQHIDDYFKNETT